MKIIFQFETLLFKNFVHGPDLNKKMGGFRYNIVTYQTHLELLKNQASYNLDAMIQIIIVKTFQHTHTHTHTHTHMHRYTYKYIFTRTQKTIMQS